MDQEGILAFSRERGISHRDATQTFLQVIVLRHLSALEVRLIGGGALVFGYGNPRFSEDVDLTSVTDPLLLKPGLVRAASEIGGWFAKPVTLTAPKKGKGTWRLLCRLGRAESIQLHVDFQPYPAHTQRPLVVEFPSIPSFVCPSLELDELMAEKVMAIAGRHYLGGRDLFDLWFHWLRLETWRDRIPPIAGLVKQKLRERALTEVQLKERLAFRLSPSVSLDRARAEWKRYLPPSFHGEDVRKEIVSRCQQLPHIFR